MATGGLSTARSAAGGVHTTTDNHTSPEEPWSTNAGNRHKTKVWKNLINLFEQDKLTDVMLPASGQSIPCHKILLAVASKFFDDKFVVHPESLEDNRLDIEGVDFDTLTAVLSFVYSGHIELTVDKTEKLIPASVSLMLPELTSMCNDFLLHKVDNDTSACINIHMIARHNSLKLAAHKAWNLMTEKFQEVSKMAAFREMSETDLQVYIGSDRLNVANENPVFEAVVTWVRHDVENRKSSFENLMKNIKLSHCSQQFLGEVVRNEELMKTADCLQHLLDAMHHHTTSPQHQSGTARGGYNTMATDNRTSPKQPSGWTTTAGEVYKARVWQGLRNYYQENELTDVMLAAEGQSIPCHKVLLSAASQFFRDKFVLHPESLEHNLLDIEGIDFDTLKSVVSFIYGGLAELTVEKTEKLIPASVSLMLPELTSMCNDFLLHKVDRETSACIDIHRIAKHNSLQLTAEKAWDLMTEKFQEVSQMAAFREMSETDLQDYIRSDELNVANENPVFEAVVTWVSHDVENRKPSFETLMEHVKLSHCSLQFLGNVVTHEPLMETVKCLRHLSVAMFHHIPSPQQADTARIGYYRLIAVYADKVYTLKGGGSDWVSKTSTAGRMLWNSSACMTGDSVVITGGNNNGRSSLCWKLTVPTMEWTALPDLNMAREHHATVCVGNQVYVLGGWDGKKRQSVEYLDEQHGSWQVTCDMPSVLYGHTAVSYKHCIYVLGDGTFMLDTVNKEWSRKADMPGGCFYVSSVVYKDRIYVLGGWKNCCMSYDPDLDQWETHSKPAVTHVAYVPSLGRRLGFSPHVAPSAVWKDRILLCGGLDTTVIEEYNPDTDTWSEWKHQLPTTENIPHVMFAVHT